MAKKATKAKTPAKGKASPKAVALGGDSTTLTPRQRIFVAEYLIDLNATQAAIRAGYSPKTAQEQASRLLSNVMVSASIQKAMDERGRALKMEAEDVLREWVTIAKADPHELSQYVREPCDECWSATGDAHERGGEIDPDCLKCRGRGYGRSVIADTRSLIGPARKLFVGVTTGKEGHKVVIRDQDKALENIARHLGMFKDKVEHSGKVEGAGPVVNVHLTHGP